MRQFKFVLLTALSVSLAGCSQMFSPSYEPLLLDYDDVSYIQERLLSLPPRDMLIEGITISNARCDQFFESLERRQSDADFSLAQLAALSTGLPPILARASVSS